MKKIICMILLLAMLLIPVASVAATHTNDIVIFFTNDIHTYIDGAITYSQLASLKKSVPGSLLVDAGDHIQGTAYGSMDKGKTMIELMNAAGYDLATLGNHEFDYTMDGTMNVLSWVPSFQS